MPGYSLELGSGAHKFIGKAIVVDSKGHHYSNDPIPLKKAKAQMRALESKLHQSDRKK